MSRGLAPTRPVSRRLSFVAENIARAVTSSMLSPRSVRNWRSKNPNSRLRRVGLFSLANLAPNIILMIRARPYGQQVFLWCRGQPTCA